MKMFNYMKYMKLAASSRVFILASSLLFSSLANAATLYEAEPNNTPFEANNFSG